MGKGCHRCHPQFHITPHLPGQGHPLCWGGDTHPRIGPGASPSLRSPGTGGFKGLWQDGRTETPSGLGEQGVRVPLEGHGAGVTQTMGSGGPGGPGWSPSTRCPETGAANSPERMGAMTPSVPSGPAWILGWMRPSRAGYGHPGAGFGCPGAGFGCPGDGYGYPRMDMVIPGWIWLSQDGYGHPGLDMVILGLVVLGAGAKGSLDPAPCLH